jgi:hypothetical protein
LILFLLLFLFQSLREVAVLMSLLVFIFEPHSPIRKRSKHRGKGRGMGKGRGKPARTHGRGGSRGYRV